MKSIIALLSLIFGASVIGGQTTGGSINTSVVAAAGTPIRCQELIEDGDDDTDCMCAEPMNSNVDLGAGGDFDDIIDWADSPSSTDCTTNSYVEIDLDSPGTQEAVTAASVPLPSGNSVSWVFHRIGNIAGAQVGPGPNPLVMARDTTWCIRHYRRWDPDTPIPEELASDDQQKIQTIGGVDGSDSIKIQFSSQATPPTAKIINAFDSSSSIWATINAGTQEWGDWQDCMSGFCRFESCVDYLSDGNAEVRFRVSRAAPLTAWVTTSKIHKGTATPASINIPHTTNGMSLFGQNVAGDKYDTYVAYHIATRVIPVDEEFWPGHAPEVEPSPTDVSFDIDASCSINGSSADCSATVTNGPLDSIATECDSVRDYDGPSPSGGPVTYTWTCGSQGSGWRILAVRGIKGPHTIEEAEYLNFP